MPLLGSEAYPSVRRLAAPCSHEELLRILHYDPETGVFTRLTGQHAGKRAGSNIGQIRINSTLYFMNRVAWFYMTGHWPGVETIIDHENHDRLDNRWENLRAATHAQNAWNFTRRMDCGVYLTEKGTWRTHLSVNGKLKYLGRYNTKEEALAVYIAAVKQHRGDFAHVN